MVRKGKIIINNLNLNTTADEIFSYFLQGGSISKCYVLMTSKNESSGSAIVQYTDIDSAIKILQSRELILDGRCLKFEVIHQKDLLYKAREMKLKTFENSSKFDTDAEKSKRDESSGSYGQLLVRRDL